MASRDHVERDSRGPEAEAMKEAFDLIHSWTPVSDVFALKYQVFITSLFTSGSAAYINAYYRKAVKLRRHGFIVTTLPVVVLPAIAGGLMHHHFVQRPLLLQTFKCPVCLELRGGIVQAVAGALYPAILAPLSAFQFAARYYTYPIPEFSEPMRLLKEFYKISRPLFSRFYIILGIQMVIGTAITHWEAHNLFTVLSKVSSMEEVLRSHQEGHHEEERYGYT